MERITVQRLVARLRDPVAWGGILVFVVTQIVYLLTLTISCPFWDSGEFIATSYVLGIPHPPGTPLYVLIGRLFCFLPIGQIAMRVNYLSALASSLAVLFSYLIIVQMARTWRRDRETALDRWIAIGGGIVGGFFMAFSRTFWDNAIEAEVYGLSSFMMVFAVWLALRWERVRIDGERDPNLLVLIGFLLFAAVGIHMGTLLVAPPILIFVLLTARRTVLNSPFLTTAFAALGAWLLFTLVHATKVGTGVALFLAVAAFAGVIAWKWRRLGARNLAFWMLVLAFLGLSVHFFLLIRARLHPPINEADPSTWQNLWLVLSRDQYKPPNPFVKRQATWAIQLSKHFWRYWHDQYHLGIRPAWFAMALPFGIGAVGAVVQALRDRRRFLFMLALVFFTTLFLVFYLNFKEDEVRDRDYFFVAGFHFFAIWIGLGAAAIAHWLRGEPHAADAGWREPGGAKLFGLGAIGILAVLALLPARYGWHTHDRTGFLIARDYAYNMLYPLDRDAILFTNGDNDTFPLWYLQEVEKIRKDVRVVNLSLLNTQWYIRQIRDDAPRVRVTLSEREIDDLHGVMYPDGRVVLIKDVMVRHILEANRDRAIYIAVTVPDVMGLDKRLVMEGLAMRIAPDEAASERVDVEKTWRNLREVFQYRGLLDAQGYYDTTVYKDDQARRLIQNYASAYVRIAHDALQRNDEARAMEALEYARRINPAFPGVLYTLGYLWLEKGEYARAESTLREMVRMGETSAEIYRLLAAALVAQERMPEAEAIFRDAIQKNPEDFDSYRALFTHLWSLGRRPDAVQLIEGWLARHPEDNMTRQALRELLASPEAGDSAVSAPPPRPRPAARGR